uniref:TctD-like protein n=1 Tax=Rhodogorgon sp. TaxID=2485824 RepID=A0A3G3MHU9_9FLOR|nr:hypothetical protein [Rhodogorgon sp.]
MSKQILIVDDDMQLGSAIQSYLSLKGYKVYVANDPSMAFLLLDLHVFDLIISDIMMPQMNGYEFVIKLRSCSSLSKVPVVFLTAKGMTEDRIKGYNLGCYAYLTKPFHPSELLSIINNILNNLALLRKISCKGQSHYLSSGNQELANIQLSDFTLREISILRLLIKGKMNKEIASNLHLSVRNVEKYVSRLLSKTNTRNRTELAQLPWQAILRANDGTRTRE